MKHKRFYIGLFVLTVMLLALPAVQQHTHLFKLRPLKGAFVKTERPQLNYRTFMTGAFQKQEDQYLTENIGFRELYVRSYNQLCWSLFRKIQNETLFISDDNWIFNDFAIKHHYGQSVYDYAKSSEQAIAKMNADALMLYKLQQVLKSYGITLFVCLAPSKDMVCEEHLPQVDAFTREPGVLAIDYYPPLFDSLGINYINFSAYFMAIKDTVSYPLYLKTSSHWSNQAAVFAADTLFRYMEHLSGINLTDLGIGEEYKSKPHFQDDDLEELMNLLWPIERKEYTYNRIWAEYDSTAVKPNLLTVGDSYYWGFLYNLQLDYFFNRHPYWYYNTSITDDPIHQNVSEIDYLKMLLSSDIIMLIYSPCNLFDLNRHFLTKSLFALLFDDDVTETKINELKQDIKNNPDRYARIEEQAMAKGQEVDKVLEDNVQWLLMNKPGDYFEAFNGTTVPTCRNSRIDKVWHDVRDEDRAAFLKQVFKNEQWLNSIKEKAKANNITVEEAIERDWEWLLRTKNME